MNKKVYFAGSIRGGRDDARIYEEMISYIEGTDVVLTKHVGNLALSSYEEEGLDEKIYQRDTAWLREADMLIAECSTPSLGVGYELAYAERFGLPVHVFYQKEIDLSAMIKGDPYFHLHPYKDEKELFRMIDVILERKEDL